MRRAKWLDYPFYLTATPQRSQILRPHAQDRGAFANRA
jgi:hypothetical protein